MKQSFFIIVVLFANLPALAQSARFERYCSQLEAKQPSQRINANSKTIPFRAIIDSAYDVEKRMKSAIELGLDYKEFKEKAGGSSLPLNDDYHSVRYASLAREKCESTEGGRGAITTATYFDPTNEQSLRRVDDSGIGARRADYGGGDTDSGSPTTGDGEGTR